MSGLSPNEHRPFLAMGRKNDEVRHKITPCTSGDFWQRYLIIKEPKKLIYVTTGNIKNIDLILLFDRNIHLLLAELTSHNVVEINQEGIFIRF